MKPVDERNTESTVELSKAELELIQGGAEGLAGAAAAPFQFLQAGASAKAK